MDSRTGPLVTFHEGHGADAIAPTKMIEPRIYRIDANQSSLSRQETNKHELISPSCYATLFNSNIRSELPFHPSFVVIWKPFILPACTLFI